MVPMIAVTVTVTATLIARRLDGYCICTARLRARPARSPAPAAPGAAARDARSPGQ
jgi:hypothetical protein